MINTLANGDMDGGKPVKHTGNAAGIAKQYVWRDRTGLKTLALGSSAGSRKLYANLDLVPPGAYSTRFHSHSQQEEFFYVLSGRGTLRLNEGEMPVGAGDFLAKPAGEGIAHTFYNSGTEILQILDVGTREPEDTCYYPEEQMYMRKTGGQTQSYAETALTRDWEPEPNP